MPPRAIPPSADGLLATLREDHHFDVPTPPLSRRAHAACRRRLHRQARKRRTRRPPDRRHRRPVLITATAPDQATATFVGHATYSPSETGRGAPVATGFLNEELFATLYRASPEQILLANHPHALAVKVSLPRPVVRTQGSNQAARRRARNHFERREPWLHIALYVQDYPIREKGSQSA